MYKILVAEDEPEIQNYLGLALRRYGYEICFAQTAGSVTTHLERHPETRLLLVDLAGIRTERDVAAWQGIRRRWPDLPVLTFGGVGMSENISSISKNTSDFLPLPIEDQDLLDAAVAALEGSTSNGKATPTNGKPEIAHATPAETWSQHVETLTRQLRGFDVPVLVRGETGVGKEVLARKLHGESKRANRPFLKLNCAALPAELVESELFGYERGAFTGAFKNTPGKFEMANGGTILLDEIGDMDFRLQAKLLQVLQDREFHRLGAKDVARVDVRVMAATHCDLEQAIVERRFREDLYYRLNIVEIHIPPLRERRSEILPLAEELLRKYSAAEEVVIPADLRSALLEHGWPGNVRELENVMRKFLVFGNADLVIRELRKKAKKISREVMPVETVELPHSFRPQPTVPDFEQAAPVHVPRPAPFAHETSDIKKAQSSPVQVRMQDSAVSILAEVDEARKKAEAGAILTALNATLWNRKEAARLLEVDYKALLYKMKKLGIGAKGGNSGESKPTFAA